MLENTENVSSCFRAVSKTNTMCLSNCMFRWFVWNQLFVYCAALNLWRIIKSWNWKLFRALEATVMATGIGCSPIRFYVCYFFCHCSHGAQVQGNVPKLSDETDPSAVQYKGVIQDHKPASAEHFLCFLCILFDRHGRIIAFFNNTTHHHHNPHLRRNLKQNKQPFNSA